MGGNIQGEIKAKKQRGQYEKSSKQSLSRPLLHLSHCFDCHSVASSFVNVVLHWKYRGSWANAWQIAVKTNGWIYWSQVLSVFVFVTESVVMALILKTTFVHCTPKQYALTIPAHAQYGLAQLPQTWHIPQRKSWNQCDQWPCFRKQSNASEIHPVVMPQNPSTSSNASESQPVTMPQKFI